MNECNRLGGDLISALETTGKWAAGGSTRTPIDDAALVTEEKQAADNDAALDDLKRQLSGVKGFAGAVL